MALVQGLAFIWIFAGRFVLGFLFFHRRSHDASGYRGVMMRVVGGGMIGMVLVPVAMNDVDVVFSAFVIVSNVDFMCRAVLARHLLRIRTVGLIHHAAFGTFMRASIHRIGLSAGAGRLPAVRALVALHPKFITELFSVAGLHHDSSGDSLSLPQMPLLRLSLSRFLRGFFLLLLIETILLGFPRISRCHILEDWTRSLGSSKQVTRCQRNQDQFVLRNLTLK